MIDSAIGDPENDGVPFRYAGGSALITTCKDFPEGAVPEWVEALEKPNGKDPGTITVMTLKVGEGLEAPSRASVTRWSRAALAEWEIPVESFSEEGARKDSSLVLYWMPKELKPGQKRLLGYAYGTQDVPSDLLPKTKTAKFDPLTKPLQTKSNKIPPKQEPPATLKVVYSGKDKAALPARLLPAVELIMDCSYSMTEGVEGTPKIDIARRVLRDLADNLPADNLQVGLRLYGHAGFWHKEREKSPTLPLRNDDPRLNTDSELVAPISPLGAEHRKYLRAWLDWANARGKTPLCHSLLEAKKDFPAACASKTVVLLSDGMETCGGSLDEVAKAYAGSDVGVMIQVVGFDVGDATVRQQLEKIAKAGGGKYYDARDAKQLVEALRQAVPNAGFEVLASDGDKVLASGSINGKPLELPAGSYRVRLAGSKGKPTTIRLVSGQLIHVNLEESGQLALADTGKSP
jgi:Ca-activated chloride channel family protein